MPLTSDVSARIQQDFQADEIEPVTDLLSELQHSDPQIFSDRILRCALFVARGKFATLVDAVALARVDFRDLVSAAEYDSDFKQIRDFNHPFDAV
jgi:hypothetical protein